MKYQKTYRLITLLLLVVFSFSCQNKGKSRGTQDVGQPIQVCVDNYPVYYLATRIGGGEANISFPAWGEVDPAFWMPDPQSIRRFQEAEMILLNGTGYANWVERVKLPNESVVNTLDGIDDLIRISDVFPNRTWNYNLWMAPSLLMTQAGTICSAFSSRKPDSKTGFEKQLGLLQEDLDVLTSLMREKLKVRKGRVLLSNTYEFDYLFREYNLEVMHFNWNVSTSRQQGEWQRFKTYYQKYHWKAMICSQLPPDAIQEKLKQYGVEPLVLNSCANVCVQGDFLSQMKENLEKLGQLLQD